MNRFTAPAAPNAGFCRSARSRQGFARCARRYAALTRPARFARKASIGAAGILERKETQPMLDRSLTPSITVTIGRHTRLYFAFITTAPADLDSPATITLHAGNLSEVSGFAAEPLTLDHDRAARRRRGSSSWMRWSSPGSGPSTEAISICCSPAIPCSSASTPCSTGSGSASSHPDLNQVAA